MEIGQIHELLANYADAAAAYSEALEWRSQVSDVNGIFSLTQLKELTANYKALGRVHSLAREPKQAIATLNEILSILNDRIEDGLPSDVPGYAIEAVRVMLQLGEYEYSAGEITSASATYEELTILAKSLAASPPSIAEEAGLAHLSALRALGKIQVEQQQPEAALVLFREEIKLREQAVKLRPYDADAKVALAEAYAGAADCLAPSVETSRTLALFYLEQAVVLIEQLPSDLRRRSDIAEKSARFLASIAALEAPAN
jgi:tetratricopeptide (TPR) repeat protein